MSEAEEYLKDFLKQEEKKLRVGSGDDQAHVDAMNKYVNKQELFWIDFIKILLKKKDEAVSLARKEERAKFMPKVIVSDKGVSVITEQHLPKEAIEMVEARVKKHILKTIENYGFRNDPNPLCCISLMTKEDFELEFGDKNE